jgi:hypothetical protein
VRFIALLSDIVSYCKTDQKLSNLKYLGSKSSRKAFYSYVSLHFYIQFEQESTKELSPV